MYMPALPWTTEMTPEITSELIGCFTPKGLQCGFSLWKRLSLATEVWLVPLPEAEPSLSYTKCFTVKCLHIFKPHCQHTSIKTIALFLTAPQTLIRLLWFIVCTQSPQAYINQRVSAADPIFVKHQRLVFCNCVAYEWMIPFQGKKGKLGYWRVTGYDVISQDHAWTILHCFNRHRLKHILQAVLRVKMYVTSYLKTFQVQKSHVFKAITALLARMCLYLLCSSQILKTL